ncbi:hypothetical protein ElyMa_005299400 [Elysia marginata]|uniref:PiggyBac transposable element-derived protein 4 C-terminal zinc-ribbon domain-containing protein n=1 Tax=Elysia marginata TaxID=1093978 RepID=A0AAV4JYH3_9GAST|nr:hypothetical protein ElyMa_005299400 [Elysia marginata]
MSLEDFKYNLIEQLSDLAAATIDTGETRHTSYAGRPRSQNPLERFDGNRHLIKWHKNVLNCVVCDVYGVRTENGKEKRTHFICAGCSNKPYLHPNEFFWKYHTPGQF